jgi:endonuclease G, mitochondrial
MRKLIAPIVAALWVVSSGAQAEKCRPGGYDISIPAGYQHDKWVRSDRQGDIRFEYDGYTSVFYAPNYRLGDPSVSTHLAHPYWVAHELRKYVKNGVFAYADGFDRPNPWYELPQLSFLASQAGVTEPKVDKSYAGEALIWNRGHLATRNLVNRISSEAGCNSHTFANAIPQYWSFNQGDWLALENSVGALANKFGKAWAISGPVYYPGVAVETIGEPGEIKVAVPHAVFKVIVFEAGQEKNARSFLFPQPGYSKVKAIMAANGGRKPLMGYRNCRTTNQESYDFQPHASSLAEIERLTGLTFFAGASVEEKTALNSLSSRGLWPIEMQYFERPCGSQPHDES